jgi:hypothetical protein
LYQNILKLKLDVADARADAMGALATTTNSSRSSARQETRIRFRMDASSLADCRGFDCDCGAGASFAQSHPEFVPWDAVSAALYKRMLARRRTSGSSSATARRTYLNHIACRELSSRGFPGALLQHEIPEQRDSGPVGRNAA